MSKITWNEVDWTLVQKRLFRQQSKVYKARIEGNLLKVRTIQKRILQSMDAKLTAVRLVTTKHQYHNDTQVYDHLLFSDENKIQVAISLKLKDRSPATLQSSKSTLKKTKTPPIPVQIVKDRAKQMLVKFALEPEWEAVFEPNSYGFRPGRSHQDAISSVYLSVKRTHQYILTVDIRNSFENLSHTKLLKKLNTFNQLESQVCDWLKSNILGQYSNQSSKIIRVLEKKPESEIISPLLINIALHGLENYIKDWYLNLWSPKTQKGLPISMNHTKSGISLVRYAAEVVITAPTVIDILKIKEQVQFWLKEELDLNLSIDKVKIVNSMEGFEFLDFQIISLRLNNRYRVKIQPSKNSKIKLVSSIRNIIQRNKAVSSYCLIQKLSPPIFEWGNYFSKIVSAESFAKLDQVIFGQIKTWVFRRKSQGLRSRADLKQKYFPSGLTFNFGGKLHKNNWTLVGKRSHKKGIQMRQNFLTKLAWINSSRHIPVKGIASPFDGNKLYWTSRFKTNPYFIPRVSKIIKGKHFP